MLMWTALLGLSVLRVLSRRVLQVNFGVMGRGVICAATAATVEV